MANKKKVRVTIRGRVQGVCFRMEIRQAAKRIKVKGWVRNRRDGSVEAVIEGDAERVDDLLAWCRKGPPLARVDGIEIHEYDDLEIFTDFSIRSTA